MKKDQVIMMTPLTEEELQTYSGGGSPLSRLANSLLKKFTALWLIEEVIENWDDIKEGFQEGWEAGGN